MRNEQAWKMVMQFRQVDWAHAAELWRSGLDTNGIASLFWVHESIVYNNLNRITSVPNSMARAS